METIVPGTALGLPEIRPGTTTFSATRRGQSLFYFDFWEWKLQLILWKFAPPVLVILGTMFNGMTIVVVIQRQFGKSSTRILLISLAVADTGVLLTKLVRRWGEKTFNLDFPYALSVFCPIDVFFIYFFRHFSSWGITLITIERWISVTHPLRAKMLCTRKNTYIALSISVVVISALNSHILFFYEILDTKNVECYIRDGTLYKSFWLMKWYWIDLMAFSGLPFLAISYCNCSILYQVLQGQKMRNKLQNSGDHSVASAAKLTSMTRMLTIVSVVFILLTLPVSVHFIVYGQLIVSFVTQKQIAQYVLSYTVTNLLSYVNNTINFLLYCLSGTQFRREVFQMFRCRKSGNGRKSSQTHSRSSRLQTRSD
ncbi:FMRFamide receptor-like [Lineus longissimus]|uniref:FMRFamide receptor-like n=1 Tax=Lineus longissimus TaxID=88925 RepID=UPI00315C663C